MQPIEINKHQFFKIELLEVPLNKIYSVNNIIGMKGIAIKLIY
jgi:hypothetical protein